MDVREVELYIRELAEREGGVVVHSLSVCGDIVSNEVKEASFKVIDGIFMGESSRETIPDISILVTL